MDSALTVIPYSFEEFIALLMKHSDASNIIIKQKLHGIYFKEYFNYLETRTIVIEKEYIDRDYLEDFADYYVRCFHDYGRKCVRLHFFDKGFTEEDFFSSLENSESSISEGILQESYLGFIVVKPLPKTIIGRTCLKTYKSEGRRFFPTTRKYEANLHGIDLSVETLAFQEQDSVAAACATSALWSGFHATGKLFQHRIPSPIKITETAIEHWTSKTRILPNAGLTAEQMAFAIRKVGLEPLFISPTNEIIFKSTLYAYLKCGIPVFLGAVLEDYTNVQGDDEPVELGSHAITLSGYSTDVNSQLMSTYGLSLKATKIDKVYGHDDQVGPFARMIFQPGYLDSSWLGSDGNMGNVRIVPNLLMIPLYHKIRIPFQTVLNCINGFNSVIKSFTELPESPFPGISWDIYLTTVNDLKRDIRKSSQLDNLYKRQLLTAKLPKYIWRATAFFKDESLLDIIFDATDIEQSEFLSLIIHYNGFFSYVLQGDFGKSLVKDYPDCWILRKFSGT